MNSIVDPRKLGISWTSRVFSGPDSRDFLHRITTLDVKHLQPGAASSWGFILTPVGKIRSAFHLAAIGPDSFLFEYDSGVDGIWDRALSEAIDQFTFSERQALGPAQGESREFVSRWVFAQESPKGFGLRVVDHGTLDFGRRWWSVWGSAEEIESHFKEQGTLTAQGLHSWRTEALRPWYSVEITPEVMPLEVGLLDGITQGKGCYPGQEVIERILTQGAPPRRLARIQTSDGARILGLVKKSETGVGTRVHITQPGGEKIEGQVEKCVEFNVL